MSDDDYEQEYNNYEDEAEVEVEAHSQKEQQDQEENSFNNNKDERNKEVNQEQRDEEYFNDEEEEEEEQGDENESNLDQDQEQAFPVELNEYEVEEKDEKDNQPAQAEITNGEQAQQKGESSRHLQNLISDNSIEMKRIREKMIQGDFQGGYDEAQAFLDTNPKCIEALNLRIHCEKQLHGDNQKCIQELKQCLERDKENTLTLFNLASCSYEVADFQDSIKYYEKLASLQPDDARICFNLALCYEKVGDTFSAQVNYDKTLKIDNSFGEAVVNYSHLLMRVGELEQARLLLESHLRNRPRDQKAINNLSIILAEKWQEKKAEQLFRSVLRNQMSDFTPTLLYNQGVLLYKQNKLVAALETFQKFVQIQEVNERDPLNILAYVNQGVIFEKLGQYESALTVYETVKKISE